MSHKLWTSARTCTCSIGSKVAMLTPRCAGGLLGMEPLARIRLTAIVLWLEEVAEDKT